MWLSLSLYIYARNVQSGTQLGQVVQPLCAVLGCVGYGVSVAACVMSLREWCYLTFLPLPQAVKAGA